MAVECVIPLGREDGLESAEGRGEAGASGDDLAGCEEGEQTSQCCAAALPYMTNCGKIIYFISQRRISWSAMKYSAFSEETRE